MKNKNNNRTKPDVESLDKDIAILKFAKSIDKTDKQIKKIVKKDLIVLGSIIGTGALYLVFMLSGLEIPAMVVACVAGGVGLVPLVKTIKKDLSNEMIERRNMKLAMNSLNDSDLDGKCSKCKDNCDGKCLDDDKLYQDVFEEVDLNFALSPKIDLDFEFDMEDALDFEKNYTADFKRFLETNDEKTLDDKPDLKLIHINLTKKETMEKLVKELEVYYNMYKIPTLTISNKEWDIVFDELYNSFCEKNREKEYSNYMSKYLKNVIVQAIVEKTKSIGFNEFYNGLDIIFDIKIFDNIFSKREMINIKKKILLNVEKNKIVDLSQYKKQNRKR